MALESSSPPLPGSHFDAEDEHDVMNGVTSTERMTKELWSNVTKKMKCTLGEDTTQRITVVSVIMICTIVGNLALILTLTCKRSRRIKRVNVFLINLAIGDLAVAVFTNTTEILFLAFRDWALGTVACKISVYMQIVTLASATFLLTAMSMDRYQVIVKPLQSLARRPRIWMKVTTAWVMAFVFATPQLFIFLQITEEHDGVRRRCCVSKGYTEEWQRKAYLSFLTSYILLLPTALMIFCYARIIHVVWIRARAEDALQHPDKEESTGSPRMSVRRGLVTASKRRVITMTLTVVAGFLFCQTPYFIVSMIRVYSDYRIKMPALLYFSEHIVLMHSTLNPVLYGLFTLRGYHITALIRCLTCKDVPVSHAENDLLLHGKNVEKSSCRTSSSTNSRGQVYQEATNDVSTKKDGEKDSVCTKNGPCKENSNHGDTSSSQKRSVSFESERKIGGGKEESHDSSTPLLINASNSTVELTPDATRTQVRKAHSSDKISVPVKGRVPSLSWGHDTHVILPKDSSNNHASSILSPSPWIASKVDGKSECHSCV